MSIGNGLAAIVDRLEAIEKILKEYSTAISAKKERDGDNPQRVRAEITFDDTSKSETQTEANRQHSTQEKIARYAFYAFAAAIFYAGIAALQLFESRTQTNEVFHQSEVENGEASKEASRWLQQFRVVQQQSKAAQDSVTALQAQTRQDERPYVLVADLKPSFGPNIKIRADIFFANYGKSPALKVRGRGTIFFGPDAMKQADQWFRTEALKPYPPKSSSTIIPPGVPPESDIGPGITRTTLFSARVASQEEFDYVRQHDFSAVIVVRQEYVDFAGDRYWTNGCWSYFASGAIPQCPTHNDAR